MLQRDEALRARGASVLDQEGTKIGTVEDIYVDRETDEPEWVVVKTGLLGNRVNFVPLREASMRGENLRVPYDKKMV
jgi:sporulation protein YlmC with PRC-barrel domain